MYPGLEVFKDDRLIGETDLILLFSGGSLVPGGFTLGATGLTTGELKKVG
jgi:hypothetical protein